MISQKLTTFGQDFEPPQKQFFGQKDMLKTGEV